MQVSGQFEVKISRDKVFQFASTPVLLAGCIPGCSDLNEIGENIYTAVLQVEVAFLKPKFNVSVTLAEVEEPTSLKAVIDGKPMALAGKLTAIAELHLEAVEESLTLVHYTMDQTITGKLGGIGQSVFRAKCEEMGAVFAANLKNELESREVLS